ncbi:MAG TPA: DUF4395 domain-containing protein [Ktedonobacterales bacterium]|nr:DUF4395 domain-containing protein [Ktedonobacterales bacterium]
MEAVSAAPVAAPRMDAHLLKFSQACTVLLAALAFLLQQPIITLIGCVALGLSAAVPAAGPFRLLYRGVVLRLHLWQPRIVEDDPAPHRFAQSVGAVFLLASSLVLLLTQAFVLGWTLDLIVFFLSGLNFTVGFCMGCFVYYHLGRLGLMPRTRYEGGFHWRGV